MRHCLLALALLLGALHPGSAAAELAYRTEITGIDDQQLARDLRNVSQLVQLENRPPESELALTRRAEADRTRLDAVLRAAGYYDATIAFNIDTATEPAVIRVAISPGTRYTLQSVKFVAPDGGTPPLLDRYAPADFGLQIGEPARAQPVLDAEQRIVRILAERGFPLAKISDRRVVVDKATKTMGVTYTVDAGPPAAFGPATITGAGDVSPDYIRRRIAWTEGKPYDVRLVEQTRTDLVASGLFGTVQVAPAGAVDADGRIPVTIDVTERAQRSIGVGLNYDTSLGASGRAYWEHRNLLGKAERLRITAEFGEGRQGLQGDFRKPDFGSIHQDLVATALAENESLEAYDRRRALLFSGVERRFGEIWTGGAGLQYEHTRVEQSDETREYDLFGLPVFAKRDDTDSLLDPTRGSRLAISTTPYYGSDLRFLSTRLQGSVYRAFDDARRYVIAGFAAVGTIGGESLDALPKDKRLYVGGGGSVRGYGYQEAGPLDSAGNPIGGRSSLELGVELRVKVTETIGLVPFLEAGNVYESVLPDPGEKLLYGAGLGFRYYTPIGPIRLDFAVPLDRRPEDDAFQVYISIGQAF